MMVAMNSKQEQLEAFVLSSLLPKVEGAVKQMLRENVKGAKVIGVNLGGEAGLPDARLHISVTFEGGFDLRKLKLGKVSDGSLLN